MRTNSYYTITTLLLHFNQFVIYLGPLKRHDKGSISCDFKGDHVHIIRFFLSIP